MTSPEVRQTQVNKLPSAAITSGSTGVSRRRFMKRVLAAGVAAEAVGLASARPGAPDAGAELGPVSGDVRRAQAYRIRMNAAREAFLRGVVQHPANDDEQRYPNRIGSYTKALAHNQLGEVDAGAYQRLLTALSTGRPEDFEAIPIGLGAKLTNPQSGLAFDLEGPDSHSLSIRAAPSLNSPEAAAELAELYWMAMARDVNFSDYATNPTIAAAAAELSRFSDLRAPKMGGAVTSATVFRGNTAGDLEGPYLSQFLWLDIPQGAMGLPQRLYTTMGGVNYLTHYDEWLAVQNGAKPPSYHLDPMPRYIRNLRDLSEWVHVDALYQAYHQACLILLGLYSTPGERNWYAAGGAPFDAGNPYWSSHNQSCFGTFCGPHVLSLVTEVATRALKAVWYQKWFVHRRLRPEAMAGLVHQTRTGMAERPLHAEILNAAVLDQVYSFYGSFLLPAAIPEGSPTHPSYPSGHATVAGACVTILKAWFDESTVIPNPVVPNADGTALLPYDGSPLTVGNELDKLASNIAQGRNALGIHYRTDYWEGLKLGEQVAIGILQEQKPTYNEGGSWTLKQFDGTTITI